MDNWIVDSTRDIPSSQLRCNWGITDVSNATAANPGRQGQHGDLVGNKPVVMLVHQDNEFTQAAMTLFKILRINCANIQIGPENAPAGSSSDGSPKIYIGGTCIGSSIELFDEYLSGKLTRRLNELDIEPCPKWKFDPSQMLRQWLLSLRQN